MDPKLAKMFALPNAVAVAMPAVVMLAMAGGETLQVTCEVMS
jgi:hypothetical protein